MGLRTLMPHAHKMKGHGNIINYGDPGKKFRIIIQERIENDRKGKDHTSITIKDFKSKLNSEKIKVIIRKAFNGGKK